MTTNLKPGSTVKLKGTDRTYTVVAVDNHPYMLGGDWKDEHWARLRSVTGMPAHWPVKQLEVMATA